MNPTRGLIIKSGICQISFTPRMDYISSHQAPTVAKAIMNTLRRSKAPATRPSSGKLLISSYLSAKTMKIKSPSWLSADMKLKEENTSLSAHQIRNASPESKHLALIIRKRNLQEESVPNPNRFLSRMPARSGANWLNRMRRLKALRASTTGWHVRI